MNIKRKIEEAGLENCLFIVPSRALRNVLGVTYTSSSDATHDIPCTIKEDRYKVADGYKIELAPIYEGFEKHTFYLTDLASFVEAGKITFYTKTK